MNYIKLIFCLVHINIQKEYMAGCENSLLFALTSQSAKNHPKVPDGLTFLQDAAIAAP